MEKVNNKRQERDDQVLDVRTLKEQSLLSYFDTLTLEEKRALIPDLLKKAKLCSSYVFDCVSPDFVRWLCSGNLETWKEEEIENLWEIWMFLYHRIAGGLLNPKHEQHGENGHMIWDVNYCNEMYKINTFYDGRYNFDNIEISREEFFHIVLEDSTPNMFNIRHNGNMYSFISFRGMSLNDFQKCLMRIDLTVDYINDDWEEWYSSSSEE